jgi:CheY-like chemotaxis protein
MSLVLVVDDSRSDRTLVAAFLDECGVRVVFADDGDEALNVIQGQQPDLVLTDMQMPRMNGLELVRMLRVRHPSLPVILMTAHGSEQLAAEALRAGASSYVPKENLARDLADTVRDILAVSRAKQTEAQALDYLVEFGSCFRLGSEIANHEGVIGHLQNGLLQFGLCDEMDLIRVGTALHEALVNAREHGNLELSSELREAEDGNYHRRVEERAKEFPYRERSVHVRALFTRSEAIIKIRDEGPGFNSKVLPDPTDPENLAKVSGRGLFLIQTFMDQVQFNEQGNEITMIKRRRDESGARVG